MGTIGASDLCEKFGGADGVAEAWLLGKLNGHYLSEFASEVCGKTRLDAARMRIELRAAMPPPPTTYTRGVTHQLSKVHGAELHALYDGDSKYLGLVLAECATEMYARLNK